MWIKRIIVAILVFTALTITVQVEDAAAGYTGAEIKNANCRAQPSVEDTDSCADLGIPVEDFRVNVSFVPFGLEIPGILERKTRSVKLGSSETIHGTTFRLIQRGDIACMYAYPLGVGVLRQTADHILGNNDNRDISKINSNLAWSEGLAHNCVFLPVKSVALPLPSWGDFISPVCLDFTTDDSYHTIPFLSVVVQCIQESMMNVFSTDNSAETSFFIEAQENLKGILRALLALYVIIFGLGFVLKPGGIKQKDFQWFGLRFALVWYFAVGPGMTDLLPDLQLVTRELSEMVFDASTGKYAVRLDEDYDEIVQGITLRQALVAAQGATMVAAVRQIPNEELGLDMDKDEFERLSGGGNAARTPSFMGWESDDEIEVHSYWTRPNGTISSYIELDTIDNRNIYRDFDVNPGDITVLSFYQLKNPQIGTYAGNNDVEIWWDGKLIETLRTSETVATQKRVQIDLPATGKGQARLEFRGAGPGSHGAIIDLIQITPQTTVFMQSLAAAQEDCAESTYCSDTTTYPDIDSLEAVRIENLADKDTSAFFTTEATRGVVNAARRNYDLARQDLRTYRNILHSRDIAAIPFASPDPYAGADGSCNDNIPTTTNTAIRGDFERSRCQEQAEIERLYASVGAARDIYEQKLTITSILAYDYCNFNDEEQYPYDGFDLRLWDMLDCRLGKYTGVGEIAEVPAEPQLVLIAIASLWSSVWGIVIFFFALMAIIYIVMFTLRMANIYLMATIGLIMLVYFSPLFIPSVLFNFTKYIFNAWFKQIIAYTLQPVILFGFLAIFFAITDHVVFGDNSLFYQAGSPEVVADPNKLNKFMMDPEGNCMDPDTIGCIYQTIVYGRTGNPGIGRDFMLTKLEIPAGKGGVIAFELLKLVFVFFIFYSVIGLVEQISISIVDAAGGGATALAGVPTASPIGIFKGIYSSSLAAVTTPYRATKGIIKGAKAMSANPKALRATLMGATAPLSVPLVAGAKGGGKARSSIKDKRAIKEEAQDIAEGFGSRRGRRGGDSEVDQMEQERSTTGASAGAGMASGAKAAGSKASNPAGEKASSGANKESVSGAAEKKQESAQTQHTQAKKALAKKRQQIEEMSETGAGLPRPQIGQQRENPANQVVKRSKSAPPAAGSAFKNTQAKKDKAASEKISEVKQKYSKDKPEEG
jgi:hypothetical protein